LTEEEVNLEKHLFNIESENNFLTRLFSVSISINFILIFIFEKFSKLQQKNLSKNKERSIPLLRTFAILLNFYRLKNLPDSKKNFLSNCHCQIIL